jgi:hypothetical protein
MRLLKMHDVKSQPAIPAPQLLEAGCSRVGLKVETWWLRVGAGSSEAQHPC